MPMSKLNPRRFALAAKLSSSCRQARQLHIATVLLLTVCGKIFCVRRCGLPASVNDACCPFTPPNIRSRTRDARRDGHHHRP
jgi:hypothetical protein